MKIEILATGDELLTGSLSDTNSAYIADTLVQNHLEINRHHVVGDDLNMITTLLSEIGKRANALIVTGGLGPTPDDLSAEAAAIASNSQLVFNQDAYDALCEFFERFQIPMNPSNKKQAYLPEGSKRIVNPVGTASGFMVKIENCRTYFLPGVPHEMKKMLNEQVLPDLLQHTDGNERKTTQQTIVCFGTSESTVGDAIKDIPEKIPGIRAGTRSKFPEIQIKLYATGKTENQIKNLLKKAEQLCIERMGKYIVSLNGIPMQKVVGDLLKQNKQTLAIAESCTGGLIAHLLTQVAGSSEFFLCSAVTYANESKMKILDVSPETLQNYGAVSQETVQEMAIGIRQKIGSDYALATSGIAGPSGGTPEKPVGTICMAVAYESGVHFQKVVLPFGTRTQKKELFAMVAMDMLRRTLLKMPFIFE
ncbi:Competence-induced protein CinA [Candidatus Magnetomorum sp. HK-1]|nr:Competence-induced protein CinA [Candidatus Magnetomorum sp. HK-1]